MNENPKVIQQLLWHHIIKDKITVYNSVNSDFVKKRKREKDFVMYHVILDGYI